MIKAVFFDIDGTLVSFQSHRIPQSTREALLALRSKGIKTFVATGRIRSNLAVLKADGFDYDFDAYMTMNGQYCYNKEQVIYENPIPAPAVARLVRYIEENPIPCQFMESDDTYINFVNEDVRKVYETIGSPLIPTDSLTRAFRRPVYQACIWGDPCREAELNRLLPECKTARWIPEFMDMMPCGGGKDVGIDRILEHYGISLKETMAFGDGGNDISMLRHVGLGVAMGNSEEKVKQAADAVTQDVDHDGISLALHRFQVL